MSTRERKNALYHEFARIGRAMASPARLELLDLLAQSENTVEELAAQTGLNIKNASAHLRALRMAQLVETRKEGTYVFYRLADLAVIALVRQMQELARLRLAEVERAASAYLGARQLMEPVSVNELRQRMREGDVVLLDVRPENEYLAAHIPGAISVPVTELKKRLKELPRNREIIAYCRGPYCVYAAQAEEILTRAGYRARRTETGLPDWKLLGHKVAKKSSAIKET
jgi:rhodanese-related sulfurtransferase/DNA-binding transcriptional ArsR family regulator